MSTKMKIFLGILKILVGIVIIFSYYQMFKDIRKISQNRHNAAMEIISIIEGQKER